MIKNLNYILILATIVILGAVGIAFIFGTTFSWVMSETDGLWRQTALYQDYVNVMNLTVGPMVILLVIVLGLCIPKRLFSGARLLQLMGSLTAMTLVLSLSLGIRLGISALLTVAMFMQMVVIVMTLVGSKKLVFEVTGFYIQIGSALLHMGLILFLFDLVLIGDALAQRTLHLNIFWVSTLFIGVGMVFTFYSDELSRLFSRGQASA